MYTFNEIIAKGKEAMAAGGTSTKEAEAGDTFMLSYTSGTTGMPKGVKLTHRMLINDSYAIGTRCCMGDAGFKEFDETDSYISYLPAAHSFEQALQGISYIYGMKMGFYSGDVTKLTEDAQVLKPTFFPSVPRLYNRIFGLLNGKFKSGTPEEVAGIAGAVKAKLENLHAGKGFKHEQFDQVVFSKVRPLLGG